MVNEQPEALRLADELEKLTPFSLRRDLEPTLQAAAELRRLHALNQALKDQRDELLEALKAVTTADDVVFYGSALHNARSAIAKATGETK